ncbi:MAG: biotin/lipoyl-binding protein [Chloroflexota bacterium]|nr:biotin/lipoyl-binding protein [Chloroflexota bacterium]MCY3638843.1 biotin/lipoyl-binding protein [Chloroflexota bacterium]MDE2687279.1 biotin/lipoyl-binding protein [Chloroflexota bacterium]MXY46336.1 biotin/lipoyl-binding protein [Chloroflexota bacterium]MYC08333.1 biotin/lipoyl-binding protein [Chloroflexota bacterium]
MADIPVESPITGVIVEISVSVGDTVEFGDVLVVIESMKMENEILSDYDGVVKEIRVRNNQNISQDDVMLILEE